MYNYHIYIYCFVVKRFRLSFTVYFILIFNYHVTNKLEMYKIYLSFPLLLLQGIRQPEITNIFFIDCERYMLEIR